MNSKTGSYSSNAGDPASARALSDAQLAELTGRIKRWAEELGFQQTGISDTELGDHESRLQAWLDKKFGGLIFDEVFDNAGKKRRVFLKEYELRKNGCIPQTYLELVNLLTNDLTIVSFNEEDIKFNTGLKEDFFTEKTLMRSQW